ncbi:hypothetical protein DEU56DRAFT_812395 [Suillus clintonianus]|uniref:uncharacterized protein n=1 Tax=Suillus clintonianus TaxID=1904413 RepID=UPI001B864A5F|nr:uncharacterized protein DEU56DRAFT_812395 [Suillus clintonianus]KAG2132372.1 hypothetical protein DEU56DRAFT_812395 [Suillus clintonianus]
MDIIQAQQMTMSYYAMLVPSTILIYDHMATLTEEIAFIWCRPKALSAVLFLLNRYVALLGNIYGLIGDFLPTSDESCPTYVLSKQVLVFSQAIIVCLILTLRTYALYGRSKRLLAFLGIIGLAFAGGAAAETFGSYPSTVTNVPGGCYETFTADTNIRLGLAWVVLSVYESLIFVLTVSRIFGIRGFLRLSLTMSRRNIIVVIFQDGALYFGAMTLFNIPNILTYFGGSDIIRGSLSTFTSCMSVTLISRLMLNLHKSIDTGIFSAPTWDDDDALAVLTTRVDVQSTISSHHW